MKKTLLAIGCATILSAGLAVNGQTARQPAQSSLSSDAAAAPRALINQYCLACHSEKAKAAGVDSARKLSLDSLDLAKVREDAPTWERVVRKLRAGQMPPLNMRRPEPEAMQGLVTWLENELDRNAAAYMPPPGLHRLNRTEYANVIKDLLDLDIDPAKYLPSDDSTHGFDNIAGALGISSTLVEAYVSAAGKISRLAIGEPVTPSLVVYRTLEDTSQD
jgi:mono/diheme cytochrome c family protein